jgi:hypothetical protein
MGGWPPLFAQVAPAAVGNVVVRADVDLDQLAEIGVFVVAQRFAGDPVDAGQPV